MRHSTASILTFALALTGAAGCWEEDREVTEVAASACRQVDDDGDDFDADEATDLSATIGVDESGSPCELDGVAGDDDDDDDDDRDFEDTVDDAGTIVGDEGVRHGPIVNADRKDVDPDDDVTPY